jgi:hypothetical protein
MNSRVNFEADDHFRTKSLNNFPVVVIEKENKEDKKKLLKTNGDRNSCKDESANAKEKHLVF